MLDLLVDHPEPWTPEDLARFSREDGWRVEVIDGTLIVGCNPETYADWTPEDLARFPESPLFEVLDGLLFVNAAPNYWHQEVADNLLIVLRRQLDRSYRVNRELGISLVTPPRSTAIPDLVILDTERIQLTANEQPSSIVHVVVEVASPTTERTDRLFKAEKYAEAGIPGYWRVELDPIKVIAYALRDGAYAELGAWTAGETVEVDEPVRVRFDPAVLLP